jgi:sulfoxide reductase heme-binding subunit YedZ
MQKQYVFYTKVLVWLLGLGLLGRLFWLAYTNNMGANPIEFIEHSTGLWALIFLLLSLAMTPVRLITKQVWVIQVRRLLGLWMFCFALLHVVTYVWLDFAFLWDEMLVDVFEHPRILVGFAAFVLSIPLTITSNSFMMKKLKGKWKTLHKSVYAIGLLAILHFLLLVKRDLTEPIYYAAALAVLLGVRIYFAYQKKQAVMN